MGAEGDFCLLGIYSQKRGFIRLFFLSLQGHLLTNILGGIKKGCLHKTKMWYLYVRWRKARGDVLEWFFPEETQKRIRFPLRCLFLRQNKFIFTSRRACVLHFHTSKYLGPGNSKFKRQKSATFMYLVKSFGIFWKGNEIKDVAFPG